MAKTRTRTGLLLGLALVAAGCGQDADILARVGKKSMSKVEGLAGETAGQMAQRLESLRPGIAEPALVDRVSCRLRWDQALAGASIQVRLADGGAIELTGTATDAGQRRRAVELAESTAGVAKVIDLLTVPESPNQER